MIYDDGRAEATEVDEKTRWIGFLKLFFWCSSLTFLVKIGNYLACFGRLGGQKPLATCGIGSGGLTFIFEAILWFEVLQWWWNGILYSYTMVKADDWQPQLPKGWRLFVRGHDKPILTGVSRWMYTWVQLVADVTRGHGHRGRNCLAVHDIWLGGNLRACSTSKGVSHPAKQLGWVFMVGEL